MTNLGLIAAHRAYQAMIKLQGGEPPMPKGYGSFNQSIKSNKIYIKIDYRPYINLKSRTTLLHSSGPKLLLGLSPWGLVFELKDYPKFHCKIQTFQYIIKQIETDTHSPDPYRVYGTMRNMPSFAEAFNCLIGSLGKNFVLQNNVKFVNQWFFSVTGDPYRPTNRCHVWTK